MKAYALLAAALFMPQHSDCTREFRLGSTYHEIQQGPCPDIDSVVAFVTEDSTHSGYYCPSRHTVVVGDRRTAKMDAFFLYSGK